MLPTKFQVNWPFSSGIDVKNRFLKMVAMTAILEFPIGTILATCIFDLQVSPMLLTKFQVKWLFGSEEEPKNSFSRWRPWRLFLAIFCCTSHPDVSYHVSSQLAFQFRSRSEKYIFKMVAMAAILDFGSEQF